jgi:hypothetical protein
LAPVLASAYGVVVDMWIVMHEDARSTQRVRLMFDHIAASLLGLVRQTNKKPT